ncbi:hypothetical protein ACFL1R_13345, partial [Candidatus Latescibacterota bacterium]
MKYLTKLSAAAVMLALLAGIPSAPQARVMMTGSVSGFGMNIMPTANFTVDDWFSNPGLWTITITNTGDQKTVKKAIIHINISSGRFGQILDGDLSVVGGGPKYYLTEMSPGGVFTINNTMLDESTEQMSGGTWNDNFESEVLRIGYLPEGTYILTFTLSGNYGLKEDGTKDEFDDAVSPLEIVETIEIKNPSPPELMVPEDMSENVVTVPHFAWQRPQVSDFSNLTNPSPIVIFYTLKVWKMFDERGTTLEEEDAITRIPIWEASDLMMESIDYDPGTANEELISGRKYCWQVQAHDGTGRPVSIINEGKSDVWQFTVMFMPPIISEQITFYPLSFNWSPAQAGGGVVQYRINIADNSEYTDAYREDGLVMTSFVYPQDAPPFQLGVLYYIEVQTTDELGITIGEAAETTFTIPTPEINLQSPADGSTISTETPNFSWQGNATYYVVIISAENSDWTFTSGSISEVSWIYDGEDFNLGTTYTWTVLPSNEMGDVISEGPDPWRFKLPDPDQMSLIAPIEDNVTTIYPLFEWKPLANREDEDITYNFVLETADGTSVHTASMSNTTFQYPEEAPELGFAQMYFWSVNAELN